MEEEEEDPDPLLYSVTQDGNTQEVYGMKDHI